MTREQAKVLLVRDILAVQLLGLRTDSFKEAVKLANRLMGLKGRK